MGYAALGFPDPNDDGEEPFAPNRAQRRAQAKIDRAEQKRGQKAWERKVAQRRARRPLMQAVQAKLTQIDETHVLVEPDDQEDSE